VQKIATSLPPTTHRNGFFIGALRDRTERRASPTGALSPALTGYCEIREAFVKKSHIIMTTCAYICICICICITRVAARMA
jgi:hypothetical protein